MTKREANKSEELTACAFKLFSEQGIKQVNMDAISEEAGVTKGSMYWHFKSKKELILSACKYYYLNWQVSIAKEVRKSSSCVDKVEQAIRYSVRKCLIDRNNRVFTLEVLSLSVHDMEVRNSWAQFCDTAREYYVNLLNDAISAKEISFEGDVTEAVQFMLYSMEGIKIQALYDKKICSSEMEEKICQHLLSLMQIRLKKS